MTKYEEIPPERLRCRCDANMFDFETTEEVPPPEGIIGQERGVRAVEFGLGVRGPGYNIFIAGPTGTGRSTYAQNMVKRAATGGKVPDDWCYLYNFREPDRPLAVRLPPGTGLTFRDDMKELLEDLKSLIPKAFESDEYVQQRSALLQEIQSRIEGVLMNLGQQAQAEGFTVKQTPAGLLTVPLKEDGSPFTQEEFSNLEDTVRENIEERGRSLQASIGETLHRIRNLEREAKVRLRELDRQVGLFTAGPHLDRLKEKYRGIPRLDEYFDALKAYLEHSLNVFRSVSIRTADEQPEESSEPFPPSQEGPDNPGGFESAMDREIYFNRFKVNLFIDNAKTKNAPVVIETNPSYYNLFGKIEYRSYIGTLATDFMMIKPGAVHRANGGYLIIQARDILIDPLAWDALKRTLKNGQIQVENIGEQYRMVPTTTIKPEPIPVDVKVVLIGSPYLYQLLYHFDEEFRKHFKIKADFDIEMERTPEHLSRYARFISSVCREQRLRHFDRGAVAKVVEYSSRLVEKQDKLSTRFNEVVEIIYEANAWAEKDNTRYVQVAHVEKAIEEKYYRGSLLEEKINEMIQKGLIRIETEGKVVGQVNGLSILDVGDYSFGKPSRITAQTYLGEAGVVNIEREAKMSGRIHDKGVLILQGYLGSKYAQDKPLSISASICFEQLYEGVEGDSASSTELYALLSSLSNQPIKQSLAVTGSVDQRGEIQTIGGVNQKIEGFFAVCKTKGLTGEQGVLIPYQNAGDLMLKEEVIEAVRQGKFHIYPIRNIDQGIEILTGVEASARQSDGTYPEGTINYLVERRLRESAEALSKYSARRMG